jgi:hypothetical protein
MWTRNALTAASLASSSSVSTSCPPASIRLPRRVRKCSALRCRPALLATARGRTMKRTSAPWSCSRASRTKPLAMYGSQPNAVLTRSMGAVGFAISSRSWSRWRSRARSISTPRPVSAQQVAEVPVAASTNLFEDELHVRVFPPMQSTVALMPLAARWNSLAESRSGVKLRRSPESGNRLFIEAGRRVLRSVGVPRFRRRPFTIC